MILQRLQAGATLAAGVQLLIQGAAGALREDCYRVRRGRISSRTGGYCQARRKLPKLLCRQVSEEIVEQLRQVLRRDAPGQRNVFLFDGSSIELEHCPEIADAYPPGQNQYGKSHWPVLRMVVGALYGGAVSRLKPAAAGFGTAYGAAAWALGDEIAVPALKLGSSNGGKTTVGMHLQELGAHLVYGVTLEGVRRMGIKAMRRI